MLERHYVDDEGFLVLEPSLDRKLFATFQNTRSELVKLQSQIPFEAFELITKRGYLARVNVPRDLLFQENRIHIREPGGWVFVIDVADVQGFRFLVNPQGHQLNMSSMVSDDPRSSAIQVVTDK